MIPDANDLKYRKDTIWALSKPIGPVHAQIQTVHKHHATSEV